MTKKGAVAHISQKLNDMIKTEVIPQIWVVE